MKKLCFVICLGISFTCCQDQDKTLTRELSNDGQEQWITDGRPLPTSDSLFYLNHPAPLFRKEFNIRNGVDSAILYITAAGYYKASLNGKSIGKNVLDPAWTDYSKRIYYSAYDVKEQIQDGENCVGVSLGNGFYNPLPLRKWGRRNLRNDMAVGKPTFLARLVVYYQNGETDEIVSDTSWKYAYGPMIKNSVYIGVAYDSRKEIYGWDMPGFDDQNWDPAIEGTSPAGELQKTFFPPVQITERITPVRIYSLNNGIYIVDMGVNFTGTHSTKLTGNPGDTITFRFGERIYDDGTLNPMTAVIGQIKRKGMGGPGAPEIAWQADSYVLNEKGEGQFSPDFTYHTYRYMEITGLKHEPQVSDIEGLAVNSNVISENHFSCSSELLNAIQKATERTFLSNLVSVQSDCPAREKFGYGGDLTATNESFMYNYDMQAFYRKTIYDWVDAMNDSVFVDTAPYVGIKYCGISWESAFLITQYYLYLYYNDIEIVRELYDLNIDWMDKAARIHPHGLVESGLSDHESLEPVPVELIGTCHFLQCAKIMKTFATLMDDRENEEKFDRRAEKLKDIVRVRFWDKAVKDEINRQTLFATLLYHDIIPGDEIASARDSLLHAVRRGPSGHFTTGIFGTKYILEMLSESVSAEQVFNIVNSTAYPGWGHMIDRGATTIWETWKESDDTYSNCHPMFGSVTEWFYRWLGGIRPMSAHPGFTAFTLAPSVPEDLKFVNCTYNSPQGPIISNWRKENDALIYEWEIPPGSEAQVSLETTPSEKIELIRNGEIVDQNELQGLQTGTFKLREGEYKVTVTRSL